MLRFALIVPLLYVTVLAPPRSRADQLGETLAGSIPAGALAFFETAGLAELIRQVRGSEFFQSVLASEDFKQMESKPFFKEAASSRKWAEFVLRMSIWDASEKLLGGRLALAAYPAGVGEDPHGLLLVRPAKPSDWLKRRVRFAPLVRVGLKRIGRDDFGDHVAAYQTRGSAPTFFALHDGWIVVSTDLQLLQQAVAMQDPGGGVAFEKPGALRTEPAFRSMSERMGENHLARAFVSMARLDELTGDNLGLPREIGDPVLAMFLGGVVEVADVSRFAGLTFDYDDKEVLMRAGIDARVEELGEQHRLFFMGRPAGGLPGPPVVPGFIGGFALYRPFGDWYRKQDPALQGALIPSMRSFEEGIGELLLGSEGIVGDRFAFVSAHAKDGGSDSIGITLPGFAFVVELVDPENAGPALASLFEGVLDEIDRAKGGARAGDWQQEEAVHLGVPLAFATRPGDKMAPALARVGDRAILSSSRTLCERVIEVIEGDGLPMKKGDLAAELHLTELSTFFAANREAYEAEFVRSGRSPQQAKTDYANIAKLIAGLKSLQLESGAADGTFQFTARGELR